MNVVRVAVDVPLATLFDYRCEGATQADVGARVVVPFGRKHVIGVIMAAGGAPTVAPERLRPVGRIFRDEPALPDDVLDLLRFCAAYYHHPVGEVVLAALPLALRRVNARPPKGRAPHGYRLTPAGCAALDGGMPPRAHRLRRALQSFPLTGALAGTALNAVAPEHRRVFGRLLERGWIEPISAEVGTGEQHVPSSDLVPTPEQAAAIEAIQTDGATFRVWLLQGVTGSGKTEVYLRLMAPVLHAGGQVLMLVPEINLTPQLAAVIEQRFPAHRLVSVHSGLAEGERLRNWRAAQSGEARIVLGTRSAVFTPLPRLQLVLVDEEQDASFKQIEGMRYCARDLAIWRARRRGIKVVLGSATPALETYQRALSGQYGWVRLTRRTNAAAMPRIVLLPMPRMRSAEGFAAGVREAIGARLARGEQVLVFINRRGYAPVLLCGACGWIAGCHRCSSRLVLHSRRQRLACHHCGYTGPIPRACPECGNVDLHPLGQGTQRIEADLSAAFPNARVLRIDRDSTRGRNVWEDMRGAIERREVDLLVGTQLLAKGHDFPGLSLVCVLDADRALFSVDFRAAEHLFAQLMQVAGRAGRGDIAGTVLIPTAYPEHPLYQALSAHDYDAYARVLLAERRGAGLPPFVYQAVLRAEAKSMAQALEFLELAVREARPFAGEVVLFDPAPALMARLKGRERAQLLVQAAARPALHRFLTSWIERLRGRVETTVRWAMDVDPLDI